MPKAAKRFYAKGQSPAERERAYNNSEGRKERQAFYGTQKWRRLRKWFIAHNPLCADCIEAGRDGVPATDVHHVVKRSDDPSLERDADNLRSLCAECHGKRTARGE